MSRPSKTNRAAELLAESVAKLMDSETYKAALRFRKKLHSYSFRNCWLIYLQCPEASMVAGYRRWQELGRQVKKGEKSIAILAPLVRKDEETGERELFGFKSANVFDIGQTEGDAVPELPMPELLEGDSESIRQALANLGAFAAAQGFPVFYKPLNRAKGVFSRVTKSITVRDDLPPLQTLKTSIHELAHALMHAEAKAGEQRHLHELEAESCAFLVCDALGLDTSRYSFAYLMHWADNPAELLPAAERACKTADAILEALREPPLKLAA